MQSNDLIVKKYSPYQRKRKEKELRRGNNKYTIIWYTQTKLYLFILEDSGEILQIERQIVSDWTRNLSSNTPEKRHMQNLIIRKIRK